ncbi:MAG: hypothetical protein ACREME_03305, partial [Gemmatimonadales bacterium]
MWGKRSLRAGEWVEVKSAAEILATLDEEGRREALPFMPEMLHYCGRRFPVATRAHKNCDTIARAGTMRRLPAAVHLAGLRCDGGAHGGCQAGCLLFWKETWLRRVDAPRSPPTPPTPIPAPGARCDLAALTRATRRAGPGDTRYRCQATELNAATTPLPWWQPGAYVQDLLSRNVRLRDFIRYIAIAAYNVVMRLHWRLRPYASFRGRVWGGERTPAAPLDLAPGEWVQVRSKDEIERTLDADGRNRGLSFDPEMVPYCGRTFRVLRRVERIVDEQTGQMRRISGGGGGGGGSGG